MGHIGSLDRFGYLCLVATEPVGQTRVERLGEGGVEGVGEDGRHAVVGSDDDEALFRMGEDVEVVEAGEGSRSHVGHRLGVGRTVAVPEVDGHLAGIVNAHRVCNGRQG